jgi:hypothetical protein
MYIIRLIERREGCTSQERGQIDEKFVVTSTETGAREAFQWFFTEEGWELCEFWDDPDMDEIEAFEALTDLFIREGRIDIRNESDHKIYVELIVTPSWEQNPNGVSFRSSHKY